jgi:hypothetical protein
VLCIHMAGCILVFKSYVKKTSHIQMCRTDINQKKQALA